MDRYGSPEFGKFMSYASDMDLYGSIWIYMVRYGSIWFPPNLASL